MRRTRRPPDSQYGLKGYSQVILKPEPISKPVTQTEEHAHHWIIETPNGESSKAICKTCGSKRKFKNSLYKSHHEWSAKESK